MNWEELFKYVDSESANTKQHRLSERVVEETPRGFDARLVCGLDAAYKGNLGVGVAAVWDLRASSLTEVSHSKGEVGMEYVPGLLGFREGLLLVVAAKKLRSGVDLFMVDGHGRAHPRRFGLACHVGLALDRPTVGVAKANLYGKVDRGEIRGRQGALLGRVLRSDNGASFHVSVGHRIGLDDAYHALRRSMVEDGPAPLRAAHQESVRLRSQL